MARYIPFPCADCGVDVRKTHEYGYMVTDEVWAEAGNVEGYLSIGCLEKRLGRRLVPSDFPDRPINRGRCGAQSAPLLDRMEGNRHGR